MKKIKIINESLPKRCEICHQLDYFDPEANYCSRCSSLSIDENIKAQTKDYNRISKIPFLIAGWILFCISLFLPSALIEKNSYMTGLDCAGLAFRIIPDFFECIQAAYLSLLSLCNVAMALSPIYFLFLNKNRHIWLERIIFTATLLVAGTKFVFNEVSFTIGFYIWCLSFILISCASLLSFNLRKKA